MRRFKSCSRRVGDWRWWGSLTMAPAGNKTKCFLSVNHTTKPIHHHDILMFGSGWCLVMAEIEFSLTKKKKIGRQEFLLTPIPLSPITSHFFLIPPWKWMSWVYHPFCQNDWNEIASHVNVYNRLTRHRREIISFRPKWSYDRINLPPFSKQIKSYEVTTNRFKVSI